MSARAFAVRQDVHFGADQYRPGTSDGDRLLAHELAHTVQQRGGSGTPQFGLENDLKTRGQRILRRVLSKPIGVREVEADRFE